MKTVLIFFKINFWGHIMKHVCTRIGRLFAVWRGSLWAAPPAGDILISTVLIGPLFLNISDSLDSSH